MDVDLQEAMAAGVFVEFCDRRGNTVGQAVFTDWRGKALPAVGDVLSCPVLSPASGRRKKMLGRVLSRHFEVQHDADGESPVWVRLLVAALDPLAARRRLAAAGLQASAN
ncbi:MAG: hypothetical protein WD847_10935 [Pirellulales bacterium]